MLLFLNNLHNYGWKYIISMFIKVSWQQDVKNINNGYDLIHFNKHQGYFYGTWNERQKYLTHVFNGR